MSKELSVKNENKELDRISTTGANSVYKLGQERSAVRGAMSDEVLKDSVMEYIFDGNPDSVSPLEEIRKAFR